MTVYQPPAVYHIDYSPTPTSNGNATVVMAPRVAILKWKLVIRYTLGGGYVEPRDFSDQPSCMASAAQAMRGADPDYHTNTAVKVAYCAPESAQ